MYGVLDCLIIVMIFGVNVTEEAICLIHRFIFVLCQKIQPELLGKFLNHTVSDAVKPRGCHYNVFITAVSKCVGVTEMGL